MIPPGTDNGEILRVPYIDGLRKMSLDKAEFFYVKVMVNKSDYFAREGMDIRTKMDIDAYVSLFGGQIVVKGLYEHSIKVDIPPGIHLFFKKKKKNITIKYFQEHQVISQSLSKVKDYESAEWQVIIL